MNIRYIDEPSLQFGNDQHICPKKGIYSFSPYDLNKPRPHSITLGFVGKSESIEKIEQWLEKSRSHISGKEGKSLENLFLNFPGFNEKVGFKSQIVYDNSHQRAIKNSDFKDILQMTSNLAERIELVVELYISQIKYLATNKSPQVILCILDKKIMSAITDEKAVDVEKIEVDDKEKDEDTIELEQNFRRLLKAKAMQYRVPIQLCRDGIASPNRSMQDSATIAWNFFTALYYKASGTPWALVRKDFSETTCYAGVSFFRSRDRKSLQTSIAQIFNEQGNGVILRGEEIKVDKNDRVPHLSEEQAYNLLKQSLAEYYESVRINPKRLVLHKTSNFSPDEIYGFKQAAKERGIYGIDLVAIQPSPIRLFRTKEYPPLRGTHLELEEDRHLLYTRGSVPYYETYTGMYIPSPIEVRLFEYDESPNLICEEILGLTKMNWNNTQFDRKFPITIECARNVGDILKYLGPDDHMELKYSFYM